MLFAVIILTISLGVACSIGFWAISQASDERTRRLAIEVRIQALGRKNKKLLNDLWYASGGKKGVRSNDRIRVVAGDGTVHWRWITPPYATESEGADPDRRTHPGQRERPQLPGPKDHGQSSA